MNQRAFLSKYGPWALVTGASKRHWLRVPAATPACAAAREDRKRWRNSKQKQMIKQVQSNGL